MRTYLFLVSSILTFSTVYVTAQHDAPSTVTKPKVGITILADGKPVNQQTGISRATKEIRFKAVLDTKSDAQFSDFQPDLILEDVEVSLARETRRVAVLHVNGNQALVDPAVDAQPNDRLVFRFTLVGQRKNGEQEPLSDQPIYSLKIQE